MRVSVDSQLVLHDPSPHTVETVRRAFTLPNPAHQSALIFAGERVADAIAKTICFVEEFPDGSIRLPRGTWGYVQGLAVEKRLGPSLAELPERPQDQRTIGRPLDPPPGAETVDLR